MTAHALSLTYYNLSSGSLALDRHPHPLVLLVLNTYVLFQARQDDGMSNGVYGT